MRLPLLCATALAAWLTAAPGHAEADETPAPAPAADAQAQAQAQAEPQAPPVPATPDLSEVSRAALERLAADLALENLLLKRRSAADDAELSDDPQQLDEAVARLEQRLLDLRLRRAALAAAADDGPSDPPAPVDEPAGSMAPPVALPTEPPTASAPEASYTAAGEVRGTAEGSAPYRYRYSFGLIGASGRGRVVVRGENGALRTEGYNFSEFRDDAVWVKLLFRHDGDTPQRFTGVVALGRRTAGLGRPRVGVLATVSLSTPVLQPGEIFEVDREVRVDRARDVDFVEVGRVRSFPAGNDRRVGAAGPG